MENVILENAYVNYDGRVQIDYRIIIISLWNKLIEEEGREENKVYPNNEEFFENSFENAYDAAFAVSSGKWRWTDDYVYLNSEGYLFSFSHLDDENSPIDMDRIDISHLINGLQDLQTNNVNNIPRAIHDALQEG